MHRSTLIAFVFVVLSGCAPQLVGHSDDAIRLVRDTCHPNETQDVPLKALNTNNGYWMVSLATRGGDTFAVRKQDGRVFCHGVMFFFAGGIRVSVPD